MHTVKGVLEVFRCFLNSNLSSYFCLIFAKLKLRQPLICAKLFRIFSRKKKIYFYLLNTLYTAVAKRKATLKGYCNIYQMKNRLYYLKVIKKVVAKVYKTLNTI